MDYRIIRAKRAAILDEIRMLEEKRCNHCSGRPIKERKRKNYMNCDCDANLMIKQLGDVLLSLTSPREHEGVLDKVKSTESLSVKEFIYLFESEVDMNVIIDHLNTTRRNFGLWRKHHGLSGLQYKTKDYLDEVEKRYGNKVYVKGWEQYE